MEVGGPSILAINSIAQGSWPVDFDFAIRR